MRRREKMMNTLLSQILLALMTLMGTVLIPQTALSAQDDQKQPQEERESEHVDELLKKADRVLKDSKSKLTKLEKFFTEVDRALDIEKQLTSLATRWIELDEWQEKNKAIMEEIDRDEAEVQVDMKKTPPGSDVHKQAMNELKALTDERRRWNMMFDHVVVTKDQILKIAAIIKQKEKLDESLSGKSITQAVYKEERRFLEYQESVEKVILAIQELSPILIEISEKTYD
jgi:hypothetical protein